MGIKKYRPLFELLVLAAPAFGIHKLIFHLNATDPKFNDFHTSIESMYGFFLLCSTAIIFILIQIRSRRIENVGYSFLLLTCAKMGIAYAFLRPILNSGSRNLAFEKINFLIVFIVFLAIETVVTIRILNKKD